MTSIIAQILGGLASASSIISRQQKHKGNTLIFNSGMQIFSMLQYLLLSAYTGVFIKISNIIRNIVLYTFHKKGKEPPIWLAIVFAVTTITGGLLGWKDWFSILPTIGVTAYTIALCQKNMTIIRCTSILTISSWIIYSFVNGAYVGTVGLSIDLCSSLIAVIRLDIQKQTT